ncbi:hypothetical protein BaRGS_00018486, partial [Batillaria attramentaria]
LTSRAFQGFPDIVEVECTGQNLPQDHVLLSLALYRVSHENTVLAYVNFVKHECSTSQNFVACHIDERDTRKSRLKALVADLDEGETRAYGCNLTILHSWRTVAMMAAVGSTLMWCPVILFTVLIFGAESARTGLSYGSFQGFPDITQVECSGETLPADHDLFSIALYQVSDNRVLAFVNLRKRECSTSHSYVACHIDDADSRKSKLRALVADLNEGESRAYGCNLTSLGSGGQAKLISWSLVVTRIRLSYKSFQGFPDIIEVECSAEPLPADHDLLAIALFQSSNNKVLAYVNLKKRECSTSESFVACHVGDTDSGQTTLSALISDLHEGESRAYGCNLTSLVSGGVTKIVSWNSLMNISVTQRLDPVSSRTGEMTGAHGSTHTP